MGLKLNPYWTLLYKTLSTQNILASLQSLFPSAVVSGDYIVFTDAVSGHQAGDEYAIRITQGSSSSSYNNGSPAGWLDVTIGGVTYHARPSFAGWSETGEFSEPTSVSDEFTDTNIVGRKIRFQLEDNTSVKCWSEGVAVSGGDIRYSSGSYYTAVAGGTTGSVQPIHHTGVVSDGGVDWEYLHSGFGSATVVSVQDSQNLTAVVDGFLPVLQPGQASYTWRNFQWSMWGYKQKYPNQVFFFKGRLCYFCPTEGYGCWFQASKTDDFIDFDVVEYGQVLDTCAINNLVSGYPDNNINWVLSGDRLYCGSYSGEYNVWSGDNTGAVSPTACVIDPITSIGGAAVQALRFRGLNLFVGRRRDEIYSISYDYTTDDYVPDNIGFMSSHLLSPGVRRWVALDNVDRNIYFNDLGNKLRTINYVKETKVLGYYRTNLEGEVLDVVSSNSGETSALFVLVSRDDGNGGTICTIERVESDSPSYMLGRKEFDLSIPGAQIDVTEFVGKEVWVKNNSTGQFYKTEIETTSVIPKLPGTWEDVSVGLPMKCILHGQPMSGEKLEGLQQKPVRFIVRLRDCGAFSYGSSVDFDRVYDYNNWNVQGGQQWDAAHQLITGDIQLPASFGYTVGQNNGTGEYPNDTGVGLNIETITPEPFNLLSVSCVYV